MKTQEYLSQVVNMADSQTICGTKKTPYPIAVKKDVTLGGSSEFLNKESQLRPINRQILNDFVEMAGTNDVQPITGPMDFQHVTVENSYKLKTMS
ncbi:hypothetical protein OUZ56_018725 [Daphnia magna]|uniref:Uncharacterized protein n=1 Tax=Daphnia magna TaxID=35525 RepID=A0ABQ9Z9N2_9CRUS|nr:hypothetical protein OUZ56_018725 [Daphnia magna]